MILKLSFLLVLTRVDCESFPKSFACGDIGVSCSDSVTIDGIEIYNEYSGGSIPSTIGSYSSLTKLFISGNSLSGTIPTQLGLLTNIQSLTLHNTYLTGTLITQLGQLTQLTYLYIRDNSLTGTVPTQIALLINVQSFSLYGNYLSGTIPTQLGLLTNIQYLLLSRNYLTGSIPTHLFQLTNIVYLYLHFNHLTGSISSSLSSLKSIEHLYLSNNFLTGTIPSQLGTLTNMELMDLSINSLTGTIPLELSHLTNMQLLSLSSNSICGPIPKELSSICPLDYCLSYTNADVACSSTAPSTSYHPPYHPTAVPYHPSSSPSPSISSSSPPASSSDIYGLLDCFAANEMLELESGDKLPISAIKVGLRVLSSSRDGQFKYAAVVAVPHSINSLAAVFVHIATASSDIKLTGSHILLAGPCHSTASFSRADALAVGDCIVTTHGYEPISAATEVMGRGVYSVVTTEELVVVGGVVASPFAGNHVAAHAFYGLYRFLYAIAPAAMETRGVAIAVELCSSLLKLVSV